MKKGLNPLAILIGLLAILYLLLTVPEIVEILHRPSTADNATTSGFVRVFTPHELILAIRSAILGFGTLMGVAVLIERVDRIRWNARARKD